MPLFGNCVPAGTKKKFKVCAAIGAAVTVGSALVPPEAAFASGQQQAVETQALTVTSPITVPTGYGLPVAVAADPTTPGVWFLDENESDVSMFFWDTHTTRLKQYSLGRPADHGLVYGTQAAITVAPGGTVWAGANSTLVELNLRSGRSSFIAVPAPPDNASSEAGRPGPVKGHHAIESLSAGSHGDVAVAMSGASAVMEYHSGSGSFTQLSLPNGAEPLDVAFAHNGSLGVATVNWAAGGTDDLVVIFRNGVVTPVTAGSVSISARGSQFVAAGQQGRVQTVVSPATGPPTVTSEPTSGLEVLIGPKALMMPNGNILVGTTTGFGVLDQRGNVVRSLTLPTFDCAGISDTPQAGSPTSSTLPPTCQGSPLTFVLDNAGNVWFTANYVPDKILKVPAGAL